MSRHHGQGDQNTSPWIVIGILTAGVLMVIGGIVTASWPLVIAAVAVVVIFLKSAGEPSRSKGTRR